MDYFMLILTTTHPAPECLTWDNHIEYLQTLIPLLMNLDTIIPARLITILYGVGPIRFGYTMARKVARGKYFGKKVMLVKMVWIAT
jgi:hypothetical protein